MGYGLPDEVSFAGCVRDSEGNETQQKSNLSMVFVSVLWNASAVSEC